MPKTKEEFFRSAYLGLSLQIEDESFTLESMRPQEPQSSALPSKSSPENSTTTQETESSSQKTALRPSTLRQQEEEPKDGR